MATCFYCEFEHDPMRRYIKKGYKPGETMPEKIAVCEVKLNRKGNKIIGNDRCMERAERDGYIRDPQDMLSEKQ